MIDVTTEQLLRVSDDGITGPYITVPVSQLEDLTRLLASHQVAYDVDEDAIAWDGSPEVTEVNLDRDADAAAVQRILDAVR